MYKKASIRKRCYADLNLRRSSWAVYHQNLLPYWVSRAVQRMWDVWRVRIPLSHFKEELISFFVQNFKTIYLPTKLHFFCKYCGGALWFICLHWSLRGRYLCVYASQTTIWFHSTPYIFSEPSYQSTASDILFIIITFDLTSIVYFMKTKYRQFSS